MNCITVSCYLGYPKEGREMLDDSARTPFGERVVSVRTKTKNTGAALEEPRLAMLHNRAFVVGKLVGSTNEYPRKGLNYWIPVDDIEAIFEYRDVSQARELSGIKTNHAENGVDASDQT